MRGLSNRRVNSLAVLYPETGSASFFCSAGAKLPTYIFIISHTRVFVKTKMNFLLSISVNNKLAGVDILYCGGGNGCRVTLAEYYAYAYILAGRAVH